MNGFGRECQYETNSQFVEGGEIADFGVPTVNETDKQAGYSKEC